MYLSDAIRIGSAMKPQAFGAMFHNGGSCAVGAAWDGVRLNNGTMESLNGQGQLFTALHERGCGVCQYHNPDGWAIPHMNDIHRMSREAIADWVESVEIEIGIRPAKVAAEALEPVEV